MRPISKVRAPRIAGLKVSDNNQSMAARQQAINNGLIQGALQFAIVPTGETPIEIPNTGVWILASEWGASVVNTPGISNVVKAGVHTQEVIGSQQLSQDEARYVFHAEASLSGNNVLWQVAVRAGKDLDEPGEVEEQVFPATILSTGSGSVVELHIEGRGLFTPPTLYTGPREFGVFVSQTGGAALETYTPVITAASIGTIWSDGPPLI